MSCLLCPSPAVADALCVPCGAKRWVAQQWVYGEHGVFLRIAEDIAARKLAPERAAAIESFENTSQASDFLIRLEAAKALRLRQSGVCPECERITPRDDHKENCSKGRL